MDDIRVFRLGLMLASALIGGSMLPSGARAAEFNAALLGYDNALLSQFNLVSIGNVTSANGSGVSGRAVIGGNYNTGTGAGSTDCYSASCTGNTTTGIDANGNPVNNSGNAGYGAVTVFGNIVGGLATSNGDIDAKGNLTTSTYNLNGKGGLNVGGSATNFSPTVNAPTEIRTTQASPPGSITNQQYLTSYQNNDTMAQVFAPFANNATVTNSFSNAAVNLQRGIAALPGTPGVTAQALPTSNATFFTAATDYTYNGKSYGVVTTTLANLAQQGSGFTGVANGANDAATFVIVSGDGANYLLPTLTYNDPKVIYDFVNATTLQFGGNFAGSILAPLATITQQGGTLNGSIVVASLNQSKELLSTDSFTGDLSGLTGVQFSAVPEPASLLLLGAGVAGAAFVRRRRR